MSLSDDDYQVRVTPTSPVLKYESRWMVGVFNTNAAYEYVMAGIGVDLGTPSARSGTRVLD